MNVDKVLASDWVDEVKNPDQGFGLEGFKPVATGFDTVFADITIIPLSISCDGLAGRVGTARRRIL